jgi:hypothetical protein
LEVRQDDESQDSGLEEEHANKIRDSANKLRRIVEANCGRGQPRRAIDLVNDRKAEKRRGMASADRKIDFEARQRVLCSEDNEHNFQSEKSDRRKADFDDVKYQSKITFSGDNKNSVAEDEESKMRDEENIKRWKEIQELEEDNISLHQLIKSKLNVIQELKNENLELKHKIDSYNMVNQKLSISENELRTKIEEMMNKITKLNFMLREKDEELQTANRKLSLIQIDLNNSTNIEKSLNNEIKELQKARDSISIDLNTLKSENNHLVVSLRDQKYRKF